MCPKCKFCVDRPGLGVTGTRRDVVKICIFTRIGT